MKVVALISLCIVSMIGCDQVSLSFKSNELYGVSLAKARQVDVSPAATADAARVTTQWFGTPEKPVWPELKNVESKNADGLGDSTSKLVSLENLARAAGPIFSDRDDVHRGLYREHCVVCHGLEGGGNGPAALYQDPYPRDLRHGVFKWKSTSRSSKPTRDDLRRLLANGVRGSAMPSFANESVEDREALIDYLIYLSVRGQVERGLIAAAIDELDYDVTGTDPEFQLAAQPGTQGGDAASEVLREVIGQWTEADQSVVNVAASDSEVSEAKVDVTVESSDVTVESADVTAASSVARGKEIFHGQIANCAGCHGPEGDGTLQTIDFDDWTKEYSTRIGITPGDHKSFKPMKRLGALPPRVANPRELKSGVFRGGGDAQSLYRRITQGIAGTPMPAVAVVEQANGIGLTQDQIGDLILYVQSLGSRVTP
jgi:mono/diheme cytochrome c family protein